MASAEQVKALLKSHLEGDEDRFLAIAMQVASYEARRGHGKLAEELRALIDANKARVSPDLVSSRPIPIAQPKGELSGLLSASFPRTKLREMTLQPGVSDRLGRIIREQRNLQKIRGHGLHPRRKILLVGPPGTGKSLTASMLAGELAIPLFVVRLDALITKYMGETAGKLRQIFDSIRDSRGVYFFDEFDAIGPQRGNLNDVGEIRRVLNSFLQMIDQDDSNSLVIAATNHPEILDRALFRRFDDVIEYALPEREEITALMKARLSRFGAGIRRWERIAEIAVGLSHADVTRVADEAIKDAIILDRDSVSVSDLILLLKERNSVSKKS